MAQPEKGSRIGNYRIGERIGRGGMGVVYRATHLGLDREVALKLIAEDLSEDEGFRERFRREPRIAASIDHDNVIPVFDAGEVEDHLYVAMRLVDGSDLGTILKKEGELDPERAVAIIAQVGAALDAAHEHGLVHRDVKPANILIEPRGGGEHAYLTDFGITKGGGGSVALTRTGDWVGTADYVAPEQIQGEKLDRRTDVYALGAVLYHSLTGEPPYARESEVAKIYAHLSKPVPPISEKRKDVRPELEATIRRAMAKKPKERYATAGDFGSEALAATSGDAKLSRATQKLVGAAGFGAAAAESAEQSAGETMISASPEAAEKTAAPKLRDGLRRPRVPTPKRPRREPRAEPPAAASEKAIADETKLAGPKPKRRPPKPALLARLRANRTAATALGVTAVAVLGVIGFVLGSSGGDESDGTTTSAEVSAPAAPATLTKAQFVAQADAICKAHARDVERFVQPLQPETKNDAGSLKAVFQALAPLQKERLSSLRALQVPSELQGPYNRYLGTGERIYRSTLKILAALREGDLQTYSTLREPRSNLQGAEPGLAEKAGLTMCSGGG